MSNQVDCIDFKNFVFCTFWVASATTRLLLLLQAEILLHRVELSNLIVAVVTVGVFSFLWRWLLCHPLSFLGCWSWFGCCCAFWAVAYHVRCCLACVVAARHLFFWRCLAFCLGPGHYFTDGRDCRAEHHSSSSSSSSSSSTAASVFDSENQKQIPEFVSLQSELFRSRTMC